MDMSNMFQVRSVPYPYPCLTPNLQLDHPSSFLCGALALVSRTTRMLFVWQEARAFNQPLYFNTSSVTDMGWMFAVRCASLAPYLQHTLSVPHALSLSARIYRVFM